MQRAVLSHHVFALGAWTIKEADGKFYTKRTDTPSFGKPHKTLRHACTAVARKLEEEFTTRKARLVRGGA